MPSPILAATLLVALAAAAVLYGTLMARRVHDRRVAARIRESIHLYAVVRALLADHRRPT